MEMSLLVEESLKEAVFPFEAVSFTVKENAFPVSGSIVDFFAKIMPA